MGLAMGIGSTMAIGLPILAGAGALAGITAATAALSGTMELSRKKAQNEQTKAALRSISIRSGLATSAMFGLSVFGGVTLVPAIIAGIGAVLVPSLLKNKAEVIRKTGSSVMNLVRQSTV